MLILKHLYRGLTPILLVFDSNAVMGPDCHYHHCPCQIDSLCLSCHHWYDYLHAHSGIIEITVQITVRTTRILRYDVDVIIILIIIIIIIIIVIVEVDK